MAADPGFFSAANESKAEQMGVGRVSIPSYDTKSPARKQRVLNNAHGGTKVRRFHFRECTTMIADLAELNANFWFGARTRVPRQMLIFCLLLVAAVQVHAQIAAGSLTGTVKDSSGAVVVGSTITLRNDATGVVETVQTTSTGTYVFDGINPGTYTLQASSPGFKEYLLSGVEIHVQQTVTADITFELGRIAQKLTVTAAAPLLQSEDASLGQTVGTKAVDNLPLNGRDWSTLGQLAAGVTTTPQSNTRRNYFRLTG
jgi:hypothetical protein